MYIDIDIKNNVSFTDVNCFQIVNWLISLTQAQSIYSLSECAIWSYWIFTQGDANTYPLEWLLTRCNDKEHKSYLHDELLRINIRLKHWGVLPIVGDTFPSGMEHILNAGVQIEYHVVAFQLIVKKIVIFLSTFGYHNIGQY